MDISGNLFCDSLNIFAIWPHIPRKDESFSHLGVFEEMITQPLIPKDLVAFAATAKEIGVSVAALHRWRQVNGMPCWRKGGRWFVSREEFFAWTAERSGRNQPPTITHAITHAARRREQIKANAKAFEILNS